MCYFTVLLFRVQHRPPWAEVEVWAGLSLLAALGRTVSLMLQPWGACIWSRWPLPQCPGEQFSISLTCPIITSLLWLSSSASFLFVRTLWLHWAHWNHPESAAYLKISWWQILLPFLLVAEHIPRLWGSGHGCLWRLLFCLGTRPSGPSILTLNQMIFQLCTILFSNQRFP